MNGSERLRQALARLRRARAAAPPLSVQPSTPFELQTSERLASMQRDLDRLQSRINWLLGLLASFAAANLILNLLT